MGFWDIVKDQFLDVIEFEDKSNKLVVTKFRRESGNNELKQGSKVIVRESQCAVFLKGGQLADVLLPGTYSLNTENFPILTKLEAFSYLFVSPVIADLYFVSTRQFIDNKWATKNPIMKRDKDFSMARIRAFGKFAFRISDVTLFMREIFGTKGIVMTYDIVEYLSSMVTEIFSTVVGESALSVLDLAAGYKSLSVAMQEKLNEQTKVIGILFSDVVIESISLPDNVEKLIDEQSGIGIAKGDIGDLEYLKDLFKVDDWGQVLNFMLYVVQSPYRGHLLCPCGSGKRIRNCHGEILKKVISSGLQEECRAILLEIERACNGKAKNGKCN